MRLENAVRTNYRDGRNNVILSLYSATLKAYDLGVTKLYNKTHVPDETLERILTLAGRSVGARTSGVIVKVTESQSPWRVHGTAYNYNTVYEWALSSRRNTKAGTLKQREISTDGGYITLSIPRTFRNGEDALTRAENIYSVAAHEFAHVAEYQQSGWIMRSREDRRKRHNNRPWEKSAIKAASAAMRKVGKDEARQEAILSLALCLEELSNRSR